MSELLDKISNLAFLAETDENGAPVVNETIDTQRLLELKTVATQTIEDLAIAQSEVSELTDKVADLLKINQALKLENINLTDVATGGKEEDDLLGGIIVK